MDQLTAAPSAFSFSRSLEEMFQSFVVSAQNEGSAPEKLLEMLDTLDTGKGFQFQSRVVSLSGLQCV